jgi:predicted nuclease with TOPRIM domain
MAKFQQQVSQTQTDLDDAVHNSQRTHHSELESEHQNLKARLDTQAADINSMRKSMQDLRSEWDARLSLEMSDMRRGCEKMQGRQRSTTRELEGINQAYQSTLGKQKYHTNPGALAGDLTYYWTEEEHQERDLASIER